MVDGDALPFGPRLRRFREAAGLTQAELAEQAGISVKAVSALESGRRQRPYPSTVRALADALELSESERAELTGARPARPATAQRPQVARLDLPVPPTAIIGRERELAELDQLLKSGAARMITFTGPGGVGKTRLAIEVATRIGDSFDGRAVFIPLAALQDHRLVVPTIARRLGLPEIDTASTLAQLQDHIGGQAWLLVLDNLEHLVKAAPEIADLLAGCPALTVLATSRSPLKIRAEHEYPVRPLPLPEMEHVPTVDEVASSASVQLFLERARAAVPGFELTQANCAAVAAICRRIDGLPLALELVAARVRALSPTELLARLEQLLPLLVGGSRDLPKRQQTMQAAINWSHELMSDQAQLLFRRLAVFAGGWPLEAAETVAGWGELPERDVVDLLACLVEESLVMARTRPDGTTRYRMLETIRQFAAERLEESGELDQTRDRHLVWCINFAEGARQSLRGPDQQLWLDRLELEHDNMRAALNWCRLAPTRKELELRLATALWRFWETRGHVAEGRRWLDQALAASRRAPADLRADALNAAGNLARDQGDYEKALAHHEASLELRRELGDAPGIARSLVNLGNLLLDQGKYTHARVLYVEALARFRELDNQWDIANALNNLGIVLGYLGDYDQARELLAEALELRQQLGEAASLARTLDALGVVIRRQGDLDRAAELHAESLELRRELGEPRGIAIALTNLGLVARHRQDYAAAKRLLVESLDIRREAEDRFGVALSLNALAEVARLEGDSRRALEHYREALALERQIGSNELLAAGLLGLAAIEAGQGDPERAARLLGAGDTVRESMQATVHPIEGEDYERTLALIRQRLDAGQLENAQTAGRALTPEQIADEINACFRALR